MSDEELRFNNWIRTFNLENIKNRLIENGYNTLWVVADMKEKDIKALRIEQAGDIKKLQIAVHDLKQERKPSISQRFDNLSILHKIDAMKKNKVSPSNCDYLLKILVIGDMNVGKSCLALRFADDKYYDKRPTIGIDFKIKPMYLDGKNIKLQIWDTAGQEQYRSITSGFLKGAMGILLVYDVTDKSSFDNIVAWLDFIKTNAPENVITILIANKCDINDNRKVDPHQAQQLANDNQIKFIETSAKINYNVDVAFITLATDILEFTNIKPVHQPAANITLTPTPTSHRNLTIKKCCK